MAAHQTGMQGTHPWSVEVSLREGDQSSRWFDQVSLSGGPCSRFADVPRLELEHQGRKLDGPYFPWYKVCCSSSRTCLRRAGPVGYNHEYRLNNRTLKLTTSGSRSWFQLYQRFPTSKTQGKLIFHSGGKVRGGTDELALRTTMKNSSKIFPCCSGTLILSPDPKSSVNKPRVSWRPSRFDQGWTYISDNAMWLCVETRPVF